MVVYPSGKGAVCKTDIGGSNPPMTSKKYVVLAKLDKASEFHSEEHRFDPDTRYK